jgi:hypothetical protein
MAAEKSPGDSVAESFVIMRIAGIPELPETAGSEKTKIQSRILRRRLRPEHDSNDRHVILVGQWAWREHQQAVCLAGCGVSILDRSSANE